MYLLGRLLNQLGRYDEAIDPLEGALLYRPEHWPSQLEYAIALEGAGDHTSALALMQNLLNNPAVDSSARQQIASLVQRQTSPLAPQGYASYSLATGFDDNLLGSTYHTRLELTTPAGLLPVELGADQEARPGAFVRAVLRYDGLLPIGNNSDASSAAQWRYSLEGSYRASPNYSPANQGQLGVMVERSNPNKHGPYLLVQHQTLQRAGNTALRQTQIGMGYEITFGPDAACQQRLGLALQHLSFPTSPVLNGHYTGILGQTHCPRWGLQVQVSAGQDQPTDTSRPGGALTQHSLRISKQQPLASAALVLDWEVTRQQDQSGYSPLLSNNAPRQINRHAYRLEYRWKAANGSPYIGIEWLDQHANLALFETKNRVFTLGYRSNW